MIDINLQSIAPRGGSQTTAFEELCCQIAHREYSNSKSFLRFHGAGGDGGIECLIIDSDDNQIGLQAKYVFNIDSLISQTTESLYTALRIHPELNRFIICFPFDFTGPTARRGKSGIEKYEQWRNKKEKEFSEKGKIIKIEDWPLSKLQKLLIDHDVYGGMREYFFNQTILSPDWFQKHLNNAKAIAGPRYTPEINVNTDLYKWFDAFGRTEKWKNDLQEKLKICGTAYKKIVKVSQKNSPDLDIPCWPKGLVSETNQILTNIEEILKECDLLVVNDNTELYKKCAEDVDKVVKNLYSLEKKLIEDLEIRHGAGTANSEGFRQYMAEYMCTFPAANLDDTRDIISSFNTLSNWFSSPQSFLAYEHVFVLSGVAGSGKTHGTCDISFSRLKANLFTCLVFGHQFRGEPDPWTRIKESLGLSLSISKDILLEIFDSIGEASGEPFLLCIDALNETKPITYWRERLNVLVQDIEQRKYIKLCVTCRTSFLDICIPDKSGIQIVEHKGFQGFEREACKTFFEFFKLEPPIAPILQPEFSNPLYLKLLCETLVANHLLKLPEGWQGFSTILKEFITEKEKQFSLEFNISCGMKVVSKSLSIIFHELADKGTDSLTWSRSIELLSDTKPGIPIPDVIGWLIRSDLLIEEPQVNNGIFGVDNLLRPSFERLSDFVIAKEILEKAKNDGLEIAFQPGGLIHDLLENKLTVNKNSGVIAALSILIAEENPNVEITNYVKDGEIIELLSFIVINSFVSRDPRTLNNYSEELVRVALRQEKYSYETMDTILAISWKKSKIDAYWISRLLKDKALASRDAYWSSYLYERYESNGVPKRLIEASFELPLDEVENDISERWCLVLLWFCAAADRRIKDWATRAVMAILENNQEIIPKLLNELLLCDDDEVKERALLCCYGSLILSRDKEICTHVVQDLISQITLNPENFQNGIIRDDVRCIFSLAIEIGCEFKGFDSEAFLKLQDSNWPLEIPSDSDVERWGKILRFVPNEFVSDFFKYSMNCLEPWEHGLKKEDMAKWMLREIASNMGYEASGCERYDKYLLQKYGGGRAKPKWVERIGKKYQWLAMYRIAARLSDHIDREKDKWAPEPLQTPLILVEERKLDPSLNIKMDFRKDENDDNRWLSKKYSFGQNAFMTDEEWVDQKEDIPDLKRLLSTRNEQGQEWRLLVSYTSWANRNEFEDNKPYRHLWLSIKSYLIKNSNEEEVYKYYKYRKVFTDHIPDGEEWPYGFVGEYPWGIPFNTYGQEKSESDRNGGLIRDTLIPTWNRVGNEWEYDYSNQENYYRYVPSRSFFGTNNLWWNGKNGYKVDCNKNVFLDQSTDLSRYSTLDGDNNFILEHLQKNEMSILWILSGEKMIISGFPNDKTPRKNFSQAACLKTNGSLRYGKLVLFEYSHYDDQD
jgi:hypothetical protein